MKNLKVGDRVRINCPHSNAHGNTGTIWMIDGGNRWRDESRVTRNAIGYCIDIDGHGKLKKSPPNIGDYIGFEEHELEPLVPPDELAWQQFRTHLKPNPAIIFDADPIVVSTDEEAERIADTVPNSHIIVAIYRNGRRIVLSEYYGRSQTNRP